MMAVLVITSQIVADLAALGKPSIEQRPTKRTEPATFAFARREMPLTTQREAGILELQTHYRSIVSWSWQ
jgi:hypothetical protein